MAKSMGVLPSKSLRITPWASNVIGMRDCWTARNFDNAVRAFGTWVENKSNERDADGNLVYTMEELLGLADDPAVRLHNNSVQAQMLALMLGGGG